MDPEALAIDDDHSKHPVVQQMLGRVQQHRTFSFLPGEQEKAFKVIVFCLFVLKHGLLANFTAGFGKTFLYLAVIICNPVVTLIVTETSLVGTVIDHMKRHLGDECVFRADTSKENNTFSRKATNFAEAVEAAVASRTTGPLVVVAHYFQLGGIKQLLDSVQWGQIFADETQHVRNGQHYKELCEISQGTNIRASFSANHYLNYAEDVVRPMAWVTGQIIPPQLLEPSGEKASRPIAGKIMSTDKLRQLLDPRNGYYYKAHYELDISVISKVVFLSLETVEEVLLQQLAEEVCSSFDQRLAPADPLTVANRACCCSMQCPMTPRKRSSSSSSTAQATEEGPVPTEVCKEVREAIDNTYTDEWSAAKGDVAAKMADVIRATYHQQIYPSITQGIIGFVPTKLVWVVNDVQSNFPQDNIVIFCQFSREVDQLAKLFKAEQRPVYEFDPNKKKSDLLKAIPDWKAAANNGDGAILLGTPALSVGHCLVEASRCYITTPDYCPYLDEQALRRLYRTGQKSSVVSVTRVFMKTKADESAYQIQGRKVSHEMHDLTQCMDTRKLLKIPRLSK